MLRTRQFFARLDSGTRDGRCGRTHGQRLPKRHSSLAFWLTALPMFLALVGAMLAAPTLISSFTDSQGLTILYRYSLRDDWDPGERRGLLMYFHGQSNGTREEMLDSLDTVQTLAWERGLIPVVVAASRAVRRDSAFFR